MNALACRLLAIFALALTPLALSAHKLSDSYLHLSVDGTVITGQWDIALRDLEHAIAFDANGDGKLTWGEVKQRHPEIEVYALGRLEILAGDEACLASATEHLASRRADGVYAVMRFTAKCPEPLSRLTLGYTLFFDLDPSHRGLLSLSHNGAVDESVFGPDSVEQRFNLD